MGKSISGQPALASVSSRQCRCFGDLLERRTPHRGIRVADQGDRCRRGGVARSRTRAVPTSKSTRRQPSESCA